MNVPVPVNGSMMWTPSLPSVSPNSVLQHVVDAVDDEVDDLDRRVDDAQPLGHPRERVAEELVVQLDDDLLLALRVVDARRAHLHAVIERCERVGFLVQMWCCCSTSSTALHRLRHGLLAGEAVVGEQRLEHRLGDQMLGQHLDDVVVGDASVQVVADFAGNAVECGLSLVPGRLQKPR